MGASESRDRGPRIGDAPQILAKSTRPLDVHCDVYCGRKGITRLSTRYGLGLVHLATQFGVLMEIRGRKPAYVRIRALPSPDAEARVDAAAARLLQLAQELYSGAGGGVGPGGAQPATGPVPPVTVAPPPPPTRHVGGGRGSRKARVFVILDFRQPTLHNRLLSQAAGVAGSCMVDAKRVKELVESASKDRKISARIVVGRRFYASTDGSPNGFADRIWRVWRRIGYVTMVEDGGLVDLGTVPLVLATIQRATWALGRRARVLVIMAGDGHLEHSPGYEAAVRLALDNGCRVEVWAWKACVPPLYPQLAEAYPSLVEVMYLDPYAAWLRYDRGATTPATIPVATALAEAVPEPPPAKGGGGGEGGGAAIGGAAATVATETPPPPPPMPPLGGKPDPMADWTEEEKRGGGVVQPPATSGGSSVVSDGEESDDDEHHEEGQGSEHLRQWQEQQAHLEEKHKQVDAAVGEEDEEEPPEPFLDPLTMELMADPVMTPSGRSYERATILQEISLRGREPFTQEPLAEADLRPNRALKELIDLYVAGRGK